MTSLSRWFSCAASAAGRGHLERALPCQDAAVATSGPGGACVVVCDGAGSAARSELGARAVTRALHAWLPGAHAALIGASRADAADAICRRALDALHAEAEAHGLPIADLACTLAFVSIQGDTILAGNLGDGVVGAIDSAGRARVLFGPVRGEFANTTVFLTSSQPQRRLALGHAKLNDLRAVAVMTDGAADSLLKTADMTLAPALTRVSGWFTEHDPDAVQASLDAQLIPRLLQHTRDDCTLALARRVTLDIDGLRARPPAFQRAFLGMGNAVGLRNRWRVLDHLSAHPSATPLQAGVAARVSKRTAALHMRALAALGLAPLTADADAPSASRTPALACAHA